MAKSVYLISEAAKEVCVENHVLRYWEEELALPVKRNSQGHRYYTTEDLNTFKRIKYLKEQGLQLKAIKLFLSKDGRLITYHSKEDVLEKENGGQRELSEGKNGKTSFAIHKGDKVTAFCKETSQQSTDGKSISESDAAEQGKSVKMIVDGDGSFSTAQYGKSEEQMQRDDRNDKAQKLQMILKLMIEEVLRKYDSDLKEGLKEEISEKLCTDVKDAVIKEMDYQFRMQEEREEKRGQDREERDQELLQRINEILMAKKTEKADKKERLQKIEKTKKTDEAEKMKEAENIEEAEKSEKAERTGKEKQKKQGIFPWAIKNFLS